jgi:hypothetical protein
LPTASVVRRKRRPPPWTSHPRASHTEILTPPAVLTNRCAEPVGVQIKMTAYDKSGAPIATSARWPASISNIPPGDYTISLDQYLDYDPAIVKFELVPIAVKQWR